MRLPRIMIAAAKSGSGKTIITCGLLQLLKDRGVKVSSYKCGPDYIDPMFHRSVIGIPGGNLDSFFSSAEEIRGILGRTRGEAAVIEGVMGIYDGITGGGGRGSCCDIASASGTPVILVVDVKGMGRTMLSLIKGILLDDESRLIRGVVLNRISGSFFASVSSELRELLKSVSDDRGAEVTLLGGIPDSADIHLENRHLGLLMPAEIAGLKEQLDAVSALISEHLDVDMLLRIMDSAEDLAGSAPAEHSAVRASECRGSAEISGSGGDTGSLSGTQKNDDPVLAVARDEAFCFYYEENLSLLRSCGIRIKEFSLLHDSGIPADADGLLLGGGYPELYADVLSSNTSMLRSIREAIGSGMPSLAECGGFMILLDELEDKEGRAWPMAGVIHGRSFFTGRLGRFGYVNIHENDGKSPRDPEDRGNDTAAGGRALLSGLSVKGHEFHYYDSSSNGSDAVAVKPGSGASWECMHAGEDHLWGYPHLYYPSCPELVIRFRDAMKSFRSGDSAGMF